MSKLQLIEDIEHLERQTDMLLREIDTYGYTDQRRAKYNVLRQQIKARQQRLKNKDKSFGLADTYNVNFNHYE